MAIITPALNVSDRVVDITVDPIGNGGGGGGAGVPQSRRVDTIAPLAGGGDLSADRSLSLTMTGGGSFAVGSGRVISATSPLLVNGAPSTTLDNDVSISENAFDGNNPGYVVPNPAGPTGTAYLDDTGNFSSSTVSGVPANRTLTMVPPITIDGLASADLSANRTIDAGIFTTSVKGFVPGSGGDPTKFLSADGTFKSPTFGAGFVTLQGSTPGTADTGNAHITGTMIADTAMVAGSTKKSLNGLGNEPFYVKQTSASPAVIARYNASADPTAGLNLRSARGTEIAPTTPNNGDQIASVTIEPFYGAGAYDRRDAIRIVKRQSNGPSHVPWDVDILPSQGNSSDPQLLLRLAASGLGGVGLASTFSPVSGFEVGTTFGITPKVLTAGGTYSIVEATDPASFFIDATTSLTTVNLPQAMGRAGRIYTFTKVDEAHIAVIQPTAGQSIAGGTSFAMFARGQSIVIQSDGSNWWIVSSNFYPEEYVRGVDSSTVANTVTETIISPWNFVNQNNFNGQYYEAEATGVISTTANPTIDFRVYNTGANIIADSGTVECPDTVTNAAWKLVFKSIQTTYSPPTGRIIDASLKLKASDGVFTEYNMIGTFGNPTNGPVPSYFSVQWGTADAANSLTCTAAKSKLVPKVAVI